MKKMKSFVSLMVMGICILTGVSATVFYEVKVVQAEVATENDTFTYDGTNAAQYKGEPIFIINSYGYPDSLYAFEDKLKSVKTVITDDSVTGLDFGVLTHFSEATTLHIGKKVSGVYMELCNCYKGSDEMNNLSAIEVDKENTCFTVQENVLYSADMSTLYVYPKQKKDTCFSIPDAVKNIYRDYLGVNTYLQKLHFGKSFGSLDGSFNIAVEHITTVSSGLTSLQEITVDENNAYLSAVDGVLYNKEQTKTLAWPRNLVIENIVFPSTVQSVALEMIEKRDQVKTITLSKDMENLLVADFTSRLHLFENLEEISVPSENKCFTVWKGGLYNKEKTEYYGFPQKSSLTTLELAEGETVIETRSNVYPNIEKVILPSTFIKYYTHEGGGFEMFGYMFPNLKSIQISTKCKTYKSVKGVVYNKKGTKLIAYPAKKEGTSYTIPDAVTSMEGHTFFGCTKLKTLTIGKKLRMNWGWYELMKTSSITSFKTVKNCKDYKAKDGVLYNKKMTILEAYPRNKKTTTYKVPESVTDIEGLIYAKNLKKLVLGKKVRYIGEFDDMKKLTSIVVSKSNPYYMSKNGVLYNKKGTKVIYNPKK